MLTHEISEETAQQARENLANGVAGWIVVSGKQCSGKDTIAPEILPMLGYTEIVRVGYSDPMKDEYQALIDAVARYADMDVDDSVIADEIVIEVGYEPQHAATAVKLLRPRIEAGEKLVPSERTSFNRTVLVEIGSTWRCGDDPEYWSKVVRDICLSHLAKGTSVYLTGGRFEPDVRIPQEAGATIVRLDITPETQADRMFKRDGILPDPAVVNHPSETQLDDWEHFDVRINNDGTYEECIIALKVSLKGKAKRG